MKPESYDWPLFRLTGLTSTKLTKPTCTSFIVHFESLSSCPDSNKVHLTCFSTKHLDEDRNHTHIFHWTHSHPYKSISCHSSLCRYVGQIHKQRFDYSNKSPSQYRRDQGQRKGWDKGSEAPNVFSKALNDFITMPCMHHHWIFMCIKSFLLGSQICSLINNGFASVVCITIYFISSSLCTQKKKSPAWTCNLIKRVMFPDGYLLLSPHYEATNIDI